MASDIEICNLALSSLGADLIRAFDDSSKRARVCKVQYAPLRDLLISQYDWSFARKFATLRAAVDVDSTNFGVAYDIPADCLRPLDILPEGTNQRWEIAGSYLYTPVTEPILRYTAKGIGTGMYTASFIDALASELAFRIAPAIRQNDRIEAGFAQKAKLALLLAQEEDAGRGSEYRASDGDPNNDSFVDPDKTTSLAQGVPYGYYSST